MKFIIQRVQYAKVTINNSIVGEIEQGYFVLIGIGKEDTPKTADGMLHKMINLRLFPDENGKTNKSLAEVGGGLLLVSQFTLYADCRKGNRPSFTDSAPSEAAKELYDYIIDQCHFVCDRVECGRFGKHMEVSLLNDGPFTIVLDSDDLSFHNS